MTALQHTRLCGDDTATQAVAPPRHERRIVWLLLVVLGLLAAGCSEATTDAGSGGRPRIVVTTGMIGNMVNELVGDAAEVEVMMGPGIDPHLFDPRQEHTKAILYSDIVVYNGLHLEAKLGEAIEQRGQNGKTTLAVGELLPEAELIDADNLYDPHIWMSIDLWRQTTELTAAKLAEAMPDHAETILANSTRYAGKLAELHDWAERSLTTVPVQARVLVTAHDAFQYFGRAYDVEVYGVQGVSTLSEAGIQDVNRVVDMVVKRRVPAIFIETSVNDRQVKAIIEGAKSRGHDIDPGRTLYSDSMGAVDSDVGSYVGMMRYNVSTITTALGGTVAEENAAVTDESGDGSAPVDPAATES